MSNVLQLRRGTLAQHATFIGADSEVTVVTDDNSLRVHDGVTAGGHAIAGNGGSFSGVYTDLTGKPVLAAVATSGAYADLSGKPTIPAAQVQSDWNASEGAAEILNKPTIPVLPTLAAVATSGAFSDLSGKPTIPAAQVQSDWTASSGVTEILNKPNLAAVATSGAFADLSGKPTIPAAQVQSDWTASTGAAAILNKPTIPVLPTLAAVATSGAYGDLSGTPSIPAAQVQSDWTASTGAAAILNKPTIPAAQVQSDWNASTGAAAILNKPTIPGTLVNATLRNIATRCATPGYTNAALTSIFTRSGHINRGDSTTGFQAKFANWYATFANEFTGYANYVLSAALEYPAGTYTRLTFAGANSVTIPAGGNATSDACSVVVPIGARFWIRNQVNCPSGIFTTNGPVTDIVTGSSGDQSVSSATALGVDYTVTTYAGAGSMTAWNPPVAVLALSTKPSVIAYGDSRLAGLKDSQGGAYNGGYGGFGEVTRSFDPYVAYCNVGCPTGTAAGFVTAHAYRAALATDHTHIHLQYGINDLNAGTTAAALETSLNTIVGYFPGKKASANTIPPQCTSTDAFLTQGAQTPFAAAAARQTHNTWLRGTTHPFFVVFEVSDILEYHRTGNWITPDVDPRVPISVTFEGTHESPWGYWFLQKSGAIDGRVYLAG